MSMNVRTSLAADVNRRVITSWAPTTAAAIKDSPSAPMTPPNAGVRAILHHLCLVLAVEGKLSPMYSISLYKVNQSEFTKL